MGLEGAPGAGAAPIGAAGALALSGSNLAKDLVFGTFGIGTLVASVRRVSPTSPIGTGEAAGFFGTWLGALLGIFFAAGVASPSSRASSWSSAHVADSCFFAIFAGGGGGEAS